MTRSRARPRSPRRRVSPRSSSGSFYGTPGSRPSYSHNWPAAALPSLPSCLVPSRPRNLRKIPRLSPPPIASPATPAPSCRAPCRPGRTVVCAPGSGTRTATGPKSCPRAFRGATTIGRGARPAPATGRTEAARGARTVSARGEPCSRDCVGAGRLDRQRSADG
jgi:hypothetical protein